MKHAIIVWSPIFIILVIIFGSISLTCNSYYEEGYKDASKGMPITLSPSNQFGTSWRNGWRAYQRDSFLKRENLVCEDWCECEEDCMKRNLCVCTNGKRGCCGRGWDKVPSVTMQL